MHPVLVELTDDFKIYSYGTFIVLAFLAASFVARTRARRDLDLDGADVFNVCFAVLFVGLLGARLLYAIVNFDTFAQHKLLIFEIWKGGLVLYGGMILALAWLAWYLPRHPRLKGWALVDRLALATGIGIFVGRWASFLSGEHYGKPAPDLPWAVTFPPVDGSQAPFNQALHPTQIYHSLHGLLLFLALHFFLKRKPHPGRATGLSLVLYAVGRAVVEIWRGDDKARGMLIEGWISTSQFISIPVFFAGVAIFLARKRGEA